jgi:hypothetical protein
MDSTTDSIDVRLQLKAFWRRSTSHPRLAQISGPRLCRAGSKNAAMPMRRQAMVAKIAIALD